MATQHKETNPFNAFLSFTPTIKELTEHVNVSTNWYTLGTMLDLDQKRLQDINGKAEPSTHKMIEMFNLWLTTTPTASRRQVLEALRVSVVGEITLADEYEKHLKKLHETTYVPASTKAVSILKSNIESLNKVLVSPVQVSQLLYSKRCISEATLDEMETINQRRSLDDKKMILLTAMQETVSSDYRKLKDITTVLSDVEETRDIANQMIAKYEEKIPQVDDSTIVQPQELAGSNEDHASDILKNNYSALSQSITEPVRMARLLHEEVISDEALSCVISTRGSVSDSRAVLLKAVRDAVHSNYKHLELFVTVLRKFSETAHIGDTIFEEYRKHFKYHDDDSEKGEVYFAKQKSMHTCSSFDHQETDKHGDHKILFPRNMKNKFEDMRMKFGSTFLKVRRIFTKMKSVVNVDEVKELIIIWFPDLRSQLPDKKTIEEVLNVLKRKCNIFNIRPLENLAFEFNVEDAKPVIKSYKEEAKDFCKSVSVSLCLGEELQAVATPSRLLCETIVFVFNWDPDEYTLQDINDMFFELEPLNKCHIQIDNVGPSQSVVVNCYCPAEFTGSLILTILGKTDTLQRKGLKKFMVGNCTIWRTTQVLSESTEGADFLVQINDLKAALKAKDEWIMATQAEVAALKELSENRLKEIGALKKDLEESHCINVQKEEVMNELKEEISVLKKEIVEKENLLNQLLEDTEKELASWKELSDNRLQEIEQLQLIFEDNNIAQEHGKVENIVHLSNPSVEQCKDVNTKLNEEHKMIILDDSSSESAQFLIPRILEKRIITLYISSSALTCNDVLSFSSQLSTNQSLTTLALFNDSISDDGVTALAQSLQYNKSLQYLYLQNNPVTSACAQSLAELLLINNTLCYIHLHCTDIDTDGVLMLMESLKTNNTLRELWLDKQHEETCSALPYHKLIRNRIIFL